jgi:phospholipase/carboxylesterase
MTDSPLVIDTGSQAPDSCVIWLHGLGADGHDFEPIVPELGLDPGLNIRFIFPHAPMIPVTINQGFVMRAWYDIRENRIEAEQDEAGIRQSAQFLGQLIEEQVESGIASERIVLAGFSQGGAIALFTALRYARQLAGAMVLSSYMPLSQSLESEKNEANRDLPIFLAHGSDDPVIPVDLAYRTRGQLEQQGYTLNWHEYAGMAHGVSVQEIYDIAEWLQQTLAPA